MHNSIYNHQKELNERIIKSYSNQSLADLIAESEAKQERELDNELEKGGEGSKGGKVIGHTKSGKPIYDSTSHNALKSFNKMGESNSKLANAKTQEEHNEHYNDSDEHGEDLESSYKHFSKEDHEDAIKYHEKKSTEHADKANKTKDHDKFNNHSNSSDEHGEYIEMHKHLLDLKKSEDKDKS